MRETINSRVNRLVQDIYFRANIDFTSGNDRRKMHRGFDKFNNKLKSVVYVAIDGLYKEIRSELSVWDKEKCDEIVKKFRKRIH